MTMGVHTFLTPVIFLVLIHYISCGENLLSILQASKDAIESADVEKNIDIVNRHYFTATKEQSVWYHALKEVKEIYGFELPLEDLSFIEKLIKSAAAHYMSCLRLEPGINKAQCFSHLSDQVGSIEEGVRWELALDYKLRPDEAKYGFVYSSVGVLCAHLSLIATDSFRYYKNVRVAKLRMQPFLKALKEAQSFLGYNYVKDVKIWLLDQVSAAQICAVKEVLWKSFDDGCESRWIDTTAKREDAKVFITQPDVKNVIPENVTSLGSDNGATRQNIVVMPEAPEIRKSEPNGPSFESDYFNVEQRSVLKVLDGLGGNKGKKETRFRIQVHDYIRKKVIYEKFESADPISKGDVMDAMAHEALKVRSKYMHEFSEKLELTTKSQAITKSVMLSAVIHIKTMKYL